MNERIEHLMYQAGLTAQGCWDKLDDYDRTAIEKFAELIVRECIQQLETGKKCDPYTGELFTCDHNDNIDYQIKVLKEHFEMGLPEKFQTSMSLPVMKQAFDAIVNVLAGGDFDNPLCDLKQAALALQQAIVEAEKSVHYSDTSQERVDEIGKRKHG